MNVARHFSAGYRPKKRGRPVGTIENAFKKHVQASYGDLCKSHAHPFGRAGPGGDQKKLAGGVSHRFYAQKLREARMGRRKFQSAPMPSDAPPGLSRFFYPQPVAYAPG